MSYKLLSALFAFAFTISLYSQEDNSKFSNEFQAGVEPTKKQEEVFKKSLEVINQRVAELEKLYEKISQTPSVHNLKSISKGKDKLIVLNESKPSDFEGRQEVSHLKYIEYEISGNKVKTMKLIYEKKYFAEDVKNSLKTLTIDPAAIENSTVEEKTLADTAYFKDAKEVEKASYKDFTAETKFKTLKLVESQLLNSIYKAEILLRHNVLETDRKAVQLAEGI
ncbi:MAG: hypothetical protein KDK36_08185 [Leptospiraceae bacterium]|nr:hypothetical protein [Leptospiraceae bacterium]